MDAPTFEVLWERYRRSILYAWVAASTPASMGSKWQPIEVGRTGMARATASCADLETVEAIRTVLSVTELGRRGEGAGRSSPGI